MEKITCGPRCHCKPPRTVFPLQQFRMRPTLVIVALLGLSSLANSQYYFKDVLTLERARKKQELYRVQEVKSVKTVNFDQAGQPVEAFSSVQTVSRDYLEITTRTTSPLGKTNMVHAYYGPGSLLIKTVDSSEGTQTTISYQYEGDQIRRVESISRAEGDFIQNEVHEWYYTPNGKPRMMRNIRNGLDTTTSTFILDDNGLVTEERSLRKGRELPVIYYYYDEQQRLTDIVHYQSSVKKLLPYYIFEYDEKGQLGSMLVVPEGSSEYQKWYYSYDEDGLKLLDACYSREKMLIGKVEYSYIYY